jgi:hypothetical protein
MTFVKGRIMNVLVHKKTHLCTKFVHKLFLVVFSSLGTMLHRWESLVYQRRRRNAHERSGKWTVDIYTLESGIQLPTEGAKRVQMV